ncbi:MAG TPA: NUDIX hydrolase [Candidatus Nanopelagicales bacterium]
MVTPPAPVPPPRREGRRFTIPTPGDLRHPRQRGGDDPAETAEPPAGATASSGGRSGAAPHPAAAADRSGGPLPTDAPATASTLVGVPAGPAGPAAHGAGVAAGTSPVPRPTPATLPRRGHRQPGDEPSATAEPATSAAAPPAAPTPAALVGPVVADEPSEPVRRMFPNPATLMASGRGARKVRPGGLRARRLPKVEETSAGGVVLDLACDPPAVALIARHDRRSRLLWSLPKGHVEEGETPEQAALREVLEETGLVGRILAPLGVIDFWFVVEDKRIHKTVHHYVIEAIGGELSDEDLEVEAVEWIPYDQVVRKLAYGDERRLVEKVAQIVPGVR